VLKLIQSNKLRLQFQRRNCADGESPECQEPDPPKADFPHGWGGYSDTMHIDFKIPSEHLIEGERFDAEMQIFNLHPERRRTPVQGVLIRATETGYNYYFDVALQVFEAQYEYDLSVCNQVRRRNRQLVSDVHAILGQNVSSPFVDYDTWGDISVPMDQEQWMEDIERRLQIGVWDPFHSMLIPSIWFWRYDGSLTEPPCGEFVSWFISDVPMIISFDQLERMKKVLFTHVDQQCNPTSVHYDHSVARPIQDSAGRPVWRCKPSDFGPDPP
jgi:Eukaryotic-type carbonic anhydrase